MNVSTPIRALCAASAALWVVASFPLSAEAVEGDPAKGKEKYLMFCASCHGTEGKGDGIAAAALDPKPTDHSNPEYMDKLTDEYIFKIIKEGGPAVGKSPMMAAWGAALTDEDIHNVTAFIRTLSK